MWVKLSNSHKRCLQIYLEKYVCCVDILFCVSKHNWEWQQIINKENELSRNRPFSHSAATILVKRIHPHQNIAPLTSGSKEERIKQRGKKTAQLVQFNNSLWAHTNVLFQHQCFRPLDPFSLSLAHLAKFQLQMSLSTFPMLASVQPCSFFFFLSVPVRLSFSTRKCSSICNYTFLSLIKWLVSFPLVDYKFQELQLFLAHHCIPRRWLYR